MTTRQQARTYKVLGIYTDTENEPPSEHIEIIGDYTSADPRGAIRQVVAQHGFGPTYVAVAESSWHEETPKPNPNPPISWS